MAARHLVLCCDGTWNDPSEKTNVWQLYVRLLGQDSEVPEADGIRQHHHLKGPSLEAIYMEGVGAQGTRQGVVEGAVGLGLHRRVVDLYVLASRLWRSGTAMWIFGFSRGAWAARSLAGFIGAAGLLTPAEASAPDALVKAETRWLAFKNRAYKGQAHDWRAQDPQPIRLVGVWDTVGAMGIPFFNGVHSIDLLERKALDFADQDLGPRVAHGRHALSIDETRFDFQPTLWNARQGIRQLWFPGVHADVGGGYPERGLANIALGWMLEQVRELSAGDAPLLKADAPADAGDAAADRHEEATGLVWQLRPRKPREVDDLPEALHPSVTQRLRARADWRPLALARLSSLGAWFPNAAATQVQEHLCVKGEASRSWAELAPGEATVRLGVVASKWWNSTGVQVRRGQRVAVCAQGQWKDKDQVCSPDGYASSGHSILQLFEYAHARRVADADWFRLVAAVHADPQLEARNNESDSLAQAIVHNIGAHVSACDRESQLVAVGSDGSFEADRDGYLYLFANDNSAFYTNNEGTITAVVTRAA